MLLDYKVSRTLYSYTANAYFFNGYVNTHSYSLRKLNSYPFSSQFVLLDAISSLSGAKIGVPKVRSIYKLHSNLRDTYFESQDFTHSFMFEVV